MGNDERGEARGYLGAVDIRTPFDDAERQWAELVARMTGIYLSNNATYLRIAKNDLDFFDSVPSGDPVEHEFLDMRLARLGWEEDDRFGVVCVLERGGDPDTAPDELLPLHMQQGHAPVPARLVPWATSGRDDLCLPAQPLRSPPNVTPITYDDGMT